MKKIFLLSLLNVYAFSYSNLEIANLLKEMANFYKINPKILYTIAKIESNFTPFIISFTSHEKNFHFKNATTNITKYKNKYLISIKSDEENIKKIAFYLIKNGYNIDAGIMQINSINFTAHEIHRIFDIKYNIAKSMQVLSKCQNKFHNTKHIIECYNKGFRPTKFDYYAKFKNSYIKDFGELQ